MSFSISNLTEERKNRIKSCEEWRDDCPVSLNMLKEVDFLHQDFFGNVKQGKIIVLDELAKPTLDVFKKLFEIKFPIHKAIPIDYYNGSDVASMADNNSSGFNCRKIMNKDSWSSHSYGTAIDINPVQNPYVLIDHENAKASIYPEKGTVFLNRKLMEKGMVESIVEIFSDSGFTEWGGDWSRVLDYHHFQIPWEKMEKMSYNTSNL